MLSPQEAQQKMMPLTPIRTLMLVFSHPDDESLMAGGTAARYAREGVRVVLVCATRGEAVRKVEPRLLEEGRLAAIREGELLAACDILGIRPCHILGYPDRQVARVDPAAATTRLSRLIRRYHPQVVVTFDPTGWNWHPDHRAISRLTAAAVAAAAADAAAGHAQDPFPPWQPARLLYTTVPPAWELAVMPAADLPGKADFFIDTRPVAGLKAAALRAHRSQRLILEPLLLGRPDVEQRLAFETFTLAAGTPPGRLPSADLFAGLAGVDRPLPG